MKKLEYQVSFTTPAFLGNAEQQAQWRTPPFKALLRQWWRVAAAQQFNYDYEKLREAEGRLFGHAWLATDKDSKGNKVAARKSLVTMRLDSWEPGTQQSSDWPGGAMEQVITTKDGKGRVRADVYLGYGAVEPEKRKENRPITLRGGAIGSVASNNFKIRVPEDYKKEILSALELANIFGSIGSRSRNGWGSLLFEPVQNSSDLTDIFSANLSNYTRSFNQCMQLDWPHAIGQGNNNQLLIWTTEPKKDWRAAMSALAHIKVGMRAEAKNHKDKSRIGGPHLLGYPAGKDWSLSQFSKGQPDRDDQEARLAAQLRFKVIQTHDGLAGLIYHLPAKLPDDLRKRLDNSQRAWLDNNELNVWQSVHRYLDGNDKLQRMEGSK